jgi:hypothetical protein
MTTQMTTQRHEPLSLFGTCYVLELTGGRVYIGWSRNLSNRLSERLRFHHDQNFPTVRLQPATQRRGEIQVGRTIY